MHGQAIAHCDIKSKNFLLANNGAVKLADLGDAQSQAPGRGGRAGRWWGWRGEPNGRLLNGHLLNGRLLNGRLLN